MKGEIRNKRKGLMIRPENENPQQGGRKRSEKKSCAQPCHKKNVKKWEGRYTKKNTQRRKTLLTITTHFEIDASCTHYNTTNIVCL